MTEPAGCEKQNYKGDGNCDDVNNVAGCDYDGGDCCAKSVMKNGVKTGKVKTNFCSEVGVEKLAIGFYDIILGAIGRTCTKRQVCCGVRTYWTLPLV